MSATSRLLSADMEAAEDNSDVGREVLPPRACRLELKVKSYDSVMDARAWSHKICKQRDLILDTIKSDFGPCPRKLIPTRVIVETLLAGNSKEITKLRRRIADLERQLNTTSDRGDAAPLFGEDTHGENAAGAYDTASIGSTTDSTFSLCYCLSSCDQATNTLEDDEPGRLQQEIIRKDAKMAAMQNAIDILESDICEPYCVYAYINTTLEKIFAILKNKVDYRSYLESLTLKPTTNMDLKGRIVIKLKLLETFCAVLSPTSSHPGGGGGGGGHANVNYFIQQIIQTNRLRNLDEKTNTAADVDNEIKNNNVERNELIAEIIEGDEMLRTLCQPPSSLTLSEHYGGTALTESPNHLLRVQQMQTCYAELVTRYEWLEHENITLQSAVDACSCGDFENEIYDLRNKLKDHSFLQDENKRLEHKIETLEERNSTLGEELTYCKACLLAEIEVNRINAVKLENAIDDNLRLETLHEELKDDKGKEINFLERKLENEQFENASLLSQIDCLKANYEDRVCETDDGLLESMKNEIFNLKVSAQKKEEEYNILQENINSNMNYIKLLKEDIDYWRRTCEQVANHNMTLETHVNQLKMHLDDAKKVNITLNDDLEEKENAIKLMSIKITDNSQEINQLNVELERNIDEKNVLSQQSIQFKDQLSRIESENKEIINILKLCEKDTLKFGTEHRNDSKDCYKTLRRAVHFFCNTYSAVWTENNHLKSELTKIKKKIHDPYECPRSPEPTQNGDLLKEKKLLEKERELLLDTVDYTQKENKDLLKENKRFKQIHEQLLHLQNNYELLKKDYAFNKTVIHNKSNDIVYLNKTIKEKNKDISNLNLSLENINANYKKLLTAQAEESISKSKALNVSKKESSDLLNQIVLYDNMNKHFTSIKIQQDESISEKESKINCLQAICEEKEKEINNYANLKNELVKLKNTQYELCKKNNSLMKELNTLRDAKQQYETEQQSLKREIFLHTSAYEKLKKENIRLKELLKEMSINSSIQMEDLSLLKMETEKIKNQNAEHVKNSSGLNNKVSEYENMILMLTEDVLRRNDKIRLLEQHAAELEHEILELQHQLDGALSSGEQLNTLHVTNTQSSINAIQTYYQNEIQRLEADIARLTEVNLNQEKEAAVYRSKISALDAKMSIMFGELEQLMFKTKTETIAESERGSVEWVCESLKSIALLMETQQSKNICLEQTLQKLQISSQLLRSKADETINLIEKEKLLIESETTIRDIKEVTINKSADTTLLVESVLNLAREQAEQKCNMKCPDNKNENQCNVERIKILKSQLFDLTDKYERSSCTITGLRESNRIYMNFQQKCTNEIENIISSIQSQSEAIKLIKVLVKKIQIFRKSLRVKLAHKNLQTDSLFKSEFIVSETSKHNPMRKEIIIDNKTIKFDSKIVDQEKKNSRKLNEELYIKYNMNNEEKITDQFVDNDKSLNDVTEVNFAVSARISMQSLTDDYKLSMSNFNGGNKSIPTKSSQDEMSQVRFLTSMIENILYETTDPAKTAQTGENFKMLIKTIDKNYESETRLKDEKIFSDSIDSINASKIYITNEKYSNFFHIYDNDEEIENNTRKISDVEARIPYNSKPGANLKEEDYGNRRYNETRHWNEKCIVFDDYTPTHDIIGDDHMSYRSRSGIQHVMLCSDLPQMHSTISEILPNYPPAETRTCDTEETTEAAAETIAEERETKPYLSEWEMSRRMAALRIQYERQMRRVAVEHDEGVKSLQRLHEQTVQELRRAHEAEVAGLRTRADTLAAENARMLAALPPLRDCDLHCYLNIPDKTEETSESEQRQAEKLLKKPVGLSKTVVQTLELRPHSRRAGRQRRRSTTPASSAPASQHSRG